MRVTNPIYPLIVASLILFASISSAAYAANLQVTVSARELVVNEVFQLRIVADTRASSDDIDLSVLEEDFFVGRPNFGTSINIVNNQRTTRSEWNVSLAAQTEGRFTIPAFDLNGARSEPIYVRVSKDEREPQADDFVVVTNDLQRHQLYPQESTQLLSRVIIKTDPRRLQNPEISQPQVEGMQITPIGDANQFNSVLAGVEVTVVEQTYRLTAEQAGDFTLSGVGFNGTVIYGDNMRGSTRLIPTKVEPEQISISVLPPPANYTGDWLPTQSLKIEQKFIDETGNQLSDNAQITLSVGESITREIYLDIEGLEAENFPEIDLPLPTALRVYEQKPEFKQVENGLTRMIRKQVLIPQREDQITINLPEIEWWDSRNNIARTTQAISTDINIVAAQQSLYSFQPDQFITQPGGETHYGVSHYWKYATFMLAGSLLVCITVILHYIRKDRLRANVVNTHNSDPKTDPKLIDVVQGGDTQLINFHLKKWLNNQPSLSAETRRAIEEELDKMNRGQYSLSEQKWNSSELIQLLKNAKHYSNIKNSNYNLPNL